MYPWQVSWLPARRFIRHDCKPSQRSNEASGFLRTQTGNSGATAADSHRFPFSPELRIVRLLVRHRDALFNYMEGYVAESVESNVIASEF